MSRRHPFGRVIDSLPRTAEPIVRLPHICCALPAGDPTPAPVPSGAGRLTLATAEGVSWRAGWAPNRVGYVDASPQGTAQPTPSGRPWVVPPMEKAMAGDPGGLVSLVLWLQALLLGAIGAGWAAARWGGPQTWLVGAPVILAALWGASESAVELLPNLM